LTHDRSEYQSDHLHNRPLMPMSERPARTIVTEPKQQRRYLRFVEPGVQKLIRLTSSESLFWCRWWGPPSWWWCSSRMATMTCGCGRRSWRFASRPSPSMWGSGRVAHTSRLW